MLPERHHGSGFGGGTLGEVPVRPEAVERREDLLYRIDFRESREDRFDLVGTVQHRC
jgi:hypothetical protein